MLHNTPRMISILEYYIRITKSGWVGIETSGNTTKSNLQSDKGVSPPLIVICRNRIYTLFKNNSRDLNTEYEKSF
jgi:hypothetical protein